MKQRRESDPRAADLGGLLKARREEAALTRSELAQRLGISVETVSACEAGRPPRRSTLLRYLHRLPGLSADELLGVAPRHAPEASASAWASEMRAQGFLAERLEVGPEGVRVTGLRATEADPAAESVRLALRRAACTAPGSLLREVSLEKDRVEADGLVHEWTETAAGLEHRCVGERSGPFVLEIPVRRIVLRAPGSGPHVLQVVNPVAGDEDLTEALYPGGRRAGEDGTLEIVEPLPRLSYALVPEAGKANIRDPEDFGGALKVVRKRAKMSVRAVAAAGGLGPASVCRTENGCDPAWLALQGLLQALPELRPQDVLPGPAPREEWSRAQASEYFARLHGLHAAVATKIVEIDDEGNTQTVIETTGLRPRSGSLRDAKVRFPVARTAVREIPGLLDQVLSDDYDLRTQVLRDDSSGLRTSVQLRWPSNPRTGGLWLWRSINGSVSMPMSRAAARERFGQEGPWWNGVSFSPPHPVHRLRLEVVFPRSFQPADPRSGAWPASTLADPDRPPLSDAQRPRLVAIQQDDGKSRLTMSIPNPVFGLRYGIAWLID